MKPSICANSVPVSQTSQTDVSLGPSMEAIYSSAEFGRTVYPEK